MEDVNVEQEMHSEYDQALLSKIRQYQNSIIKHSESGNDAKILSYIRKLYDMPVTVAHLQETGIGRTINSLRKYSGDVGTASKAIVYKWKDMVAREEQQTTETTETTSNNEHNRRSPTPDPDNDTKQHKKSEHKQHSSEDRHSKHQSSSSDRNHKKSESTSERNHKSKTEEHVSRTKSHHRKDEKRDSHKSSHHSKEKEHKKSSDSSRKEEKHRPDKKRKHEDEQSPAKKKKYETVNDSDSDESSRLLIQENSIDSLSQSDENILPDSTTNHDSYRERTTSPPTEEVPSGSSSNHGTTKKQHKSEKHRSSNSNADSEKKQLNGGSSHSSSSKKSSHRDHSKKEKSNSNSNTNTNNSSSNSSNSKTSENKESSKKPKPVKVKKLLTADNGIDSGSGASFAEALGMIEPTKSKNVFKKKTPSSPTPSTSASTTSTSKSRTSKPSTHSPLLTQSPPANLLSSNIKLEPLDLNISQLPEITTNYKPLGQYSNYDSSSPANNLKNMTDEEALSVVISSKTQRTKVFSGNKTNWGFVPTLFQLCVRVLQDNIDALEYTGGVPYEILRPVLERATANQLLNTEYHNPYLVEDSDELWAKHCKRECRGVQRQEMESWRDMYLRCRDERDAKLKALTVNIKQSIDKSLPVRQTKLAYVDNYVKPPRAIARKQAKYGTDCKSKPLITPSSRLNSIASSSNEPRVSVPNPGTRAVSSSSGGAIKPKKAPLMQKTLALMKGRFGRR